MKAKEEINGNNPSQKNENNTEEGVKTEEREDSKKVSQSDVKPVSKEEFDTHLSVLELVKQKIQEEHGRLSNVPPNEIKNQNVNGNYDHNSSDTNGLNTDAQINNTINKLLEDASNMKSSRTNSHCVQNKDKPLKISTQVSSAESENSLGDDVVHVHTEIKTHVPSSTQHNDNTFSAQNNSNSISPPMNARRKPGRPPGSTKRGIMMPLKAPEQPQQLTQETDKFSLRKFFELGGRDFNAYLDWLKRSGKTANSEILLQMQNNRQPELPPQPARSQPNPTNPTIRRTLSTPSDSNQHRISSSISPHSPAAANIAPGYRPVHCQNGNLPPNLPPSPPMYHRHEYLPPAQPVSHQSPPPFNVPVQHGNSPPDYNDSEVLGLDLSTKRRKLAPEEEYTDITHSRFCFPQQEAYRPDLPYMHDCESVGSNGSRPQSRTEPESSTDGQISSWDVDQVAKFVTNVTGLPEYGEMFREQHIDGSTLPFLSEDHLLKHMNMKLGPAIKLLQTIAAKKSG